MNDKLEWHKNKVLELASKGNSQLDISKILRISQPTVNRDLSYLRRQAKKKIKEYINQKLPDEYERCLVGLTSVLKKAWNTASNAKKQARENTNIIISKGLLWNETRITYSCYSDGWRHQVCFWKATTTDIRPFPTILDLRKPSVKTWITPNLKIDQSLLNQTSLHLILY